ncbi:DNA polymerase POL4 [Cordyceps fumosorosea ARSEF 2679]|uniref:DNA polymerase lambda n=1 Tax=Cordyceps fumosorosea (strain ARSEF 2679) TaxID=1081104 RepID=A0A168EDY3_CORFA|nr:DNA polymerase POL4 [Cordyceps fumosorosea ARSEF 2679]OAA73696.1 DNA polymerase POL4 [Cordyceps fumosorosea ARSEF 2679]
MTTPSQQPSLEAKRAFFAHFRRLSHSEDEEDASQEPNAEGQADDEDELEPREQRMRHRHRRFFRNASPAPHPGLEVEAIQETSDAEVVVTSSARATPSTTNKQNQTPAETGGGKRSRNAVDELLDSGGEEEEEEVIGETPIDATKRRRGRASAASAGQLANYHPLPPPKLASISSSSMLRATRKRKSKDDAPAPRPEAEQVLRGLVFYYVPDDDVAPARRLRMQKAREYGAARTSDAARATHVVVDRGIGYQDAVKAVGRAAVEGGVPVVRENYPIECVQFRAVLDCRQKRYRLAGQPEDDGERSGPEPRPAGAEEEAAAAAAAAAAAKMSTRDKLQLKEPQRNPKRWDYAPTSTPPNAASEESPGVDSQPVVLAGADEAEMGHGGAAARAESVQRDTAASATTAPATAVPATTGVMTTAPGDELTKMIDMMQEFKDLPLDNDEDEDEKTTAASHDSGSGSDPDSQRRAPAAKKADTVPFAERFACARSGTLDAHAANPNARTVEVLQAMLSYYERTGDQWRVLAYRRAIATLRRQPALVSTERAALGLPGVGPRLAAKIAEVATTDRLRQLDSVTGGGGGGDAQDEAVRLFMGVHGVGPALAARWAARGLRSLEDLGEVRLTPGQRVGVQRYEDLNTRIPRDEVEALAGVVRAEAARLDPRLAVMVGGSYRRGASSSGDVDLILTRPGTTTGAELVSVLRALIGNLREAGFLVATLTAGEESGVWQGCCVLPGDGGGRWRRMDMLAVPEAQMGAALIYFTGDDVFNRSLRLLARKKGMRLNQRGLYRRALGTAAEGDLVEARCERRIFEILGVQWREPTERWC